jgi:hypothetical protein
VQSSSALAAAQNAGSAVAVAAQRTRSNSEAAGRRRWLLRIFSGMFVVKCRISSLELDFGMCFLFFVCFKYKGGCERSSKKTGTQGDEKKSTKFDRTCSATFSDQVSGWPSHPYKPNLSMCLYLGAMMYVCILLQKK